MAKEYIDRDKARDTLLYEMVGTGYQSQAVSAIEFVPTADVAEVRHGKMERDGHHLHFNCCNKVLAIIVNESDDYDNIVSCPFCGAKMDGKGEYE